MLRFVRRDKTEYGIFEEGWRKECEENENS